MKLNFKELGRLGFREFGCLESRRLGACEAKIETQFYRILFSRKPSSAFSYYVLHLLTLVLFASCTHQCTLTHRHAEAEADVMLAMCVDSAQADGADVHDADCTHRRQVKWMRTMHSWPGFAELDGAGAHGNPPHWHNRCRASLASARFHLEQRQGRASSASAGFAFRWGTSEDEHRQHQLELMLRTGRCWRMRQSSAIAQPVPSIISISWICFQLGRN